jgi:hypothetical protein
MEKTMIVKVQVRVKVNPSYSDEGQQMQAEVITEKAIAQALAHITNKDREDYGLTAYGCARVEEKERYNA